jgi:hypothetical protein
MFQQKIQMSVSDTLTIRWESNWSNLQIKFNTTDVENITDKSILEAGKWFALPNGKNLFVRLVKNELEIWDGSEELLSGLKSGQSDQFSMAWKVLMGVSILFVLFSFVGFSAYFSEASEQLDLYMALAIVALGLSYLGLALWARKTKEKLPLKIAMSLQILITIVSVLGGGIPTVLNGLVIYQLYRGINAEPLRTAKIEQMHDTGLLDDNL